jgi:hypothetical protein
MGFLRRRDRPDGEQIATATALVVEATPPSEHGAKIGPGSHAPLRVVADLGSGPRVFATKVRMTAEHWLAPGIEIPISFDAGNPEGFSVVWEQLPSMEERAAANDPALADPIPARHKAAQALGLTPADTGRWRSERFERALEEAARDPAIAGRLRGVVLIATIRGRRVITGSEGDGGGPTHDTISYQRASAAVLSVHVPRRAPYAFYASRFKCEVDLIEPTWMPLPASVATDDPQDIQILWDEVPDHEAQLADRIRGSHAAQEAQGERIDALREQLGASAFGQAAPQMQQLAADSAKQALRYVQDPKMRKLLIDQYKAAGIDVGEDA